MLPDMVAEPNALGDLVLSPPQLDELILLVCAIANCPKSAVSLVVDNVVFRSTGPSLPAKARRAWMAARPGEETTVSEGFTVIALNAEAPARGALIIAKELDRVKRRSLLALIRQTVGLEQLRAERKAAGKEIASAKAEAESKDKWLGFIVHELNSPLTTVIGFQEMLLAGDAGRLDDEQTRMLAVANRNARRLRSLVADLLLLSRVESGRFQLQIGPIDVLELLAKALEDMRLAAQDRGLKIRAEIDVLPVFNGDSERLLQLIENLLGNAIKYTDVGQVTLTAKVEKGELQIAVADSGIGIPKDEFDSLFERFYRASNIDEYGAPGTGLGLAICQIIAAAHSGRIDVVSELGKGSVFTLRLPLS